MFIGRLTPANVWLYMTISVEPEVGVPVPDGATYDDLKDYIEAAANTAADLSEHGLETVSYTHLTLPTKRIV